MAEKEFYEDATPEQQQLLSIAENRVRDVLAQEPPAFWQMLADLLGPEKTLAWAKTLVEQEKATLDAAVVVAQEHADAVAAVLAEAPAEAPMEL